MEATSVANIEAAITALVLIHIHVEPAIAAVQPGMIHAPPGVVGTFLRIPDIPPLCLDGYGVSVAT